MAGAIEIEAPVPGEIMQRYAENPTFIFGELDNGYIWIFPKADHLSIGAGGLNPKPGELQCALERAMQRLGVPIEMDARHGHPVPVHLWDEALSTHRCLLAGDSAGLVDPFTGEGIRFAIKSGRLAAQAILTEHTEEYSASVSRSIGKDLRMGNMMRRLFYRFQRTWFELALRNPLVSQGLVDIFADQIGYGKLLWIIASTFPRSLLTKKIPLKDFIPAITVQ